jgi:hypothetical protein
MESGLLFICFRIARERAPSTNATCSDRVLRALSRKLTQNESKQQNSHFLWYFIHLYPYTIELFFLFLFFFFSFAAISKVLTLTDFASSCSANGYLG